MPTRITTPLSESGARIELPFTNLFAKCSAVEWEFESVKYPTGWQGGETLDMRVGGKKKKNLTISKPQQVTDNDIIDWCNDPYAPEHTMDIVRFDHMGAQLYTDRLIGVRPISIKFGQVDADGKDLAELEIELSWQEWQRV